MKSQVSVEKINLKISTNQKFIPAQETKLQPNKPSTITIKKDCSL